MINKHKLISFICTNLNDHFSEMRSDYAEKSVNLNFMGGTFSIVYDAVNMVYNIFQDSFESEFSC